MNLVEKAIIVATKAHEGQKRKSTDIPYITHPYSVGMSLQKSGCSDEVIAAGILHDTVEDTEITLDYIRQEFNDKVADLVEAVSEPEREASWEDRKKHTIQFLKTAPLEVRLISCADKLHNISSIFYDKEKLGNDVWNRFKRGKQEQEWYYKGLVESLCNHDDIPQNVTLFKNFKDIVYKCFQN